MGVLKRLTDEYFHNDERAEDRVVVMGVIKHDFTDKNGVRHRNGYRVEDENENKNKILNILIQELIVKRGNECGLNDIDVSNILDMTGMFQHTHFNGNISGWDVSRVINMDRMFYNSDFNGNISKWDVSNVEDMQYMFCKSKFNGNISGWKVSSADDMRGMFESADFTGENGDISKWNVSGVKDMTYMFYNSHFNGDISEWEIQRGCKVVNMFDKSPLENKPPKWYYNRKY